MFHRRRFSAALVLWSILCTAGKSVDAYNAAGKQNGNAYWNNIRSSRSILHLVGGSARLRHYGAPKEKLRKNTAQQMRISQNDPFHDASKPIKAVGLTGDSIPLVQTNSENMPSSEVAKESSHAKVDLVVPLAYFCTQFAITLPVILVPAIGYQDYRLSARALTSFSTAVASVAMIGGGSGKFINGLVCQHFGGVATASTYLAGMSLCSLALSLSKSQYSVRWIVAGMEFFASAMWVASSIIFANQYREEPAKVARGVTYLSIGSSCGQLLAKTLGSALLQFTGWRSIAKLGSLVALFGSMIIGFGLKDMNNNLSPETEKKDEKIINRIRSVLISKVFWMAGCAHLAGHIAKSSDRILGPFLNEVTTLPYQVCGALTTCVTLGFVHGVMKGQSYFKLPSTAAKEGMLKRSYSYAAMSLLGLALCGSSAFRSVPSSLLATIAVICGGVCASSLAFPFYQIPNMVSSTVFAGNEALSLAYLDGVAFILAAPVWALTNRITNSLGWSATWGFVFLVLGVCGNLMMKAMQPVLAKQAQEDQK